MDRDLQSPYQAHIESMLDVMWCDVMGGLFKSENEKEEYESYAHQELKGRLREISKHEL